MAAKTCLFFILVFSYCAARAAAANKLIVVMIDGCRWDYLDDPNLELQGFQRIAENGVRASYVNPVYPSLSYPNWYSIATGLYPENHGFINNIIYDSETGKPFLMLYAPGSSDPHWWNGAEPIWVTAEKLQKNAALYWWAGCEIEIGGVKPMICERHRYGPGTEEEKKDFLERIDDIVEMFKPPHKDRLSLALMYYGSVDYTGHYSGPMTSETRRTVKDIDEILNEMLNKIEKAGLEDQVNIMIVSDHGMTNIEESTTIDMERFAEDIKFQVSSGATSMLVPEDGMIDKLYDRIKDANISGIKVFKRQDIPESYHLTRNHLVNDIFMKAEKGFYINALKDSNKRIGDFPHPYKGHHGYDPGDVEDMRTIFLATGPDFPKGRTLKSISNVDLYNVMCHVLQIQPLPNNGSSEILKDILSGDGDTAHLTSRSQQASAHILCYLLSYLIFMFAFFLIHS